MIARAGSVPVVHSQLPSAGPHTCFASPRSPATGRPMAASGDNRSVVTGGVGLERIA